MELNKTSDSLEPSQATSMSESLFGLRPYFATRSCGEPKLRRPIRPPKLWRVLLQHSSEKVVASLKFLMNQTHASELWLPNLSCGAQRRPTKRPLNPCREGTSVWGVPGIAVCWGGRPAIGCRRHDSLKGRRAADASASRLKRKCLSGYQLFVVFFF